MHPSIFTLLMPLIFAVTGQAQSRADRPIFTAPLKIDLTLVAEAKGEIIEIKPFLKEGVVRTIKAPGKLTNLWISDDERYLAGAIQGGQGIVWTVTDGKEHMRFRCPAKADIFFNKDGTFTVFMLEFREPRLMMAEWSLKTKSRVLGKGDALEGDRIAVIAEDGTVHVRTVAEEKPIWVFKPQGAVTEVETSVDARYVAAATKEGKVFVYDAWKGKEHMQIPFKAKRPFMFLDEVREELYLSSLEGALMLEVWSMKEKKLTLREAAECAKQKQVQ